NPPNSGRPRTIILAIGFSAFGKIWAIVPPPFLRLRPGTAPPCLLAFSSVAGLCEAGGTRAESLRGHRPRLQKSEHVRERVPLDVPQRLVERHRDAEAGRAQARADHRVVLAA